MDRAKTVMIASLVCVASVLDTVATAQQSGSLAIDFAFIRPGFVNWHVDRRDSAGGCDVFGALAGPWQHGLDTDAFFLTGEPLANLANGQDELIIVRPDTSDPDGQLYWAVRRNDQPGGGFSGAMSKGLFGLAGDTPFIWRSTSGFDRAAVRQIVPGVGPGIIIDSNRDLAFQITDQFFPWNVNVSPADRLFSSPHMLGGAGTLVLWRAASSTWEFYLFAGVGSGVLSETPSVIVQWGSPSMIPGVGDADGDGFDDLIMFDRTLKIINLNIRSQSSPLFNSITDCSIDYSYMLNPIFDQNWLGFAPMNLGGYDDWDRDGTPNNIDQCPSDPMKVVPGVCGCGVSDTDTDGDGVPDCTDMCPYDPLKTMPGVCGCGESDADTDTDGVLDCEDMCEFDPNKSEPGVCGCGVAEVVGDINQNGIVDGADLLLLLNWWSTADINSDISGDGTVNGIDLLILLSNWGGVCGD